MAPGAGDEKTQKLRRERGPALRRKPHVGKPLLKPCFGRTGEALLDKSKIAEYDGEQIVEVVRDAGRQLAHGLQPLHLAQSGLDPLAFFDLRDKLPVGCLDLAGALSNTHFQCFIQPAQVHLCVSCMTFTLMQRFKTSARFVLP